MSKETYAGAPEMARYPRKRLDVLRIDRHQAAGDLLLGLRHGNRLGHHGFRLGSRSFTESRRHVGEEAGLRAAQSHAGAASAPCCSWGEEKRKESQAKHAGGALDLAIFCHVCAIRCNWPFPAWLRT
eukprot:scaffold375_cov210-Pinguiococcus_pyrenoidosus.AAC.5